MAKKKPRAARRPVPKRPKSATPPPPLPATGQVDDREQTFNAGATGPVHRVSRPADLITRLNEIMIDLDVRFLRPDLFAGKDGTAAERVYERAVRGWLDRHPVLKSAEVRLSGGGLHALLRLEPAVEFRDTVERDRWAANIEVIQSSLPCDPNAPGLTALTRPVGSVNGKTGQRVAVLRPGTPVHPDAVLAFVAELQQKPFGILAQVLYGSGVIRPCPLCRAVGSSLQPRDRVGQCYQCGPVTIAQLMGTVMVDPPAAKEGN